MKKIKVDEQINFWKSRVAENVLEHDTPLNIHGWAEPSSNVPIQEWDAYYSPELNTTPTGPGGYFRIEDEENTEEYVRKVNEQIDKELKEAMAQKQAN